MSAEISVFRNAEKEKAYMAAYEKAMKLWPIPYETTRIPTRIGETHVVVSGRQGGDPIVLLHGMLSCSAYWYPNVEALGADHRLYAVDTVTDLGKSTVSVIPQTRQELADWLVELCQGLGITRPHLVGLSYGAFMAANLATHYPDWVDKLVLIAPAAVFDKVSLGFYLNVVAPVILPFEFGKDRMWEWMVQDSAVLDNACGDLARLAGRVGVPRSKVQPSVFTARELVSIEARTLLLMGDHEVACRGPRAVERAKRWVPNLRAEFVPDCGHLVPVEHPAFVNGRILDFLAAD